jgi:hypothetical protein
MERDVGHDSFLFPGVPDVQVNTLYDYSHFCWKVIVVFL